MWRPSHGRPRGKDPQPPLWKPNRPPPPTPPSPPPSALSSLLPGPPPPGPPRVKPPHPPYGNPTPPPPPLPPSLPLSSFSASSTVARRRCHRLVVDVATGVPDNRERVQAPSRGRIRHHAQAIGPGRP